METTGNRWIISAGYSSCLRLHSYLGSVFENSECSAVAGRIPKVDMCCRNRCDRPERDEILSRTCTFYRVSDFQDWCFVTLQMPWRHWGYPESVPAQNGRLHVHANDLPSVPAVNRQIDRYSIACAVMERMQYYPDA